MEGNLQLRGLVELLGTKENSNGKGLRVSRLYKVILQIFPFITIQDVGSNKK